LGVDKLPSNSAPLSHSAHDENQQKEWKKQLGYKYRIMCDFFIERNRGIEKWCPRMWPGEWSWCDDAPKKASLKEVMELFNMKNHPNS